MRREEDTHVLELPVSLTGAEDATAINHNAVAVLAGLSTFAVGRALVVSSGGL